MSLAEELRERFEYALATRAPETNAMLDALVERLRGTTSAPAQGEPAPDFELPDANGTPVRLSAIYGPVVVAFYRGGWCPYCNLQLRAYEHAELPATLLAISPQKPDATLATARENGLRYPVLSDVGNVVARRYGLVFEVPEDVKRWYLEDKGVDLAEINGAWELPVPGAFVIDAAGTIVLADVDPDYTRRLDPETIREALWRSP